MAMTETTIELVLQLELAGVPFALRGSLKDGKLESLSGLVRIEKGLKEFLEALGADFSEAREVLKQLTGGTDIKLDSLAVGYHNREPAFCQVAATFTAGKSLCRFVLLKS